MTLLLFLTGLTTIATTSQVDTGLFAVSGGSASDKFQATSVSYSLSPTSKRTA